MLLDLTDVRIFCEMAFREPTYEKFGDRHPSSAEMGKKLGLDEKTVRARVNRMEASGFIKYYQAAPSLSLFGMRTVNLFRFEALNLSTKFAVIRHLHELPRLVESADYMGSYFTASIAGATLEEAEGEARRLASRYELGVVPLGSRALREPQTRLDRLDWQLIKELRYDARASDRSLAEAASVTQRMVGYRISKLLGSGAVHVKAVIDPQRQAGLVFYELELMVDPPKKEAVSRWIEERHGNKLWDLRTPTSDIILASLFCFTMAEPEEAAVEALNRIGVKRCLLLMLKEVIEPDRPNWIDSLIELRIGSQGTNAGAI
jgi:DNA-binding Lrp family transcriptional regulator